MNQAKYNRIMKIKYKKNVVTPSDIDELYEENKNNLFNNNSVDEIIELNFKDIVTHRAKGYLEYIISKIMENKKLEHLIKDNFLFILMESEREELHSILMLNYGFDITKIINDNFRLILDNFQIEKLIDLNFNIILNDENKSLLEKKYTDNENEFVRKLLFTKFSYLISDKEKEILENILGMMIDEIRKKENIRLVDIKKVLGGNYSNVVIIGDKVLKVGTERMKFNIPNNKYILTPIIRKDLTNISSIPFVVEISERVDTNVNLTDEELYQFYRKLRMDGIIWTDIKNDNIGILLKDNIVHYDNVSLDNSAKGIAGADFEPLKKGEYVIIDTDFIYDEDDENVKWGNTMAINFETRYINELNSEFDRNTYDNTFEM